MDRPIINGIFAASSFPTKAEVKAEQKEQNKKEPKAKEITKRLNDINTFQCVDNELCLVGKDEQGQGFTIWFDAYDFLTWIDTEQIEYIKEKLIKHIQEL